MTRFSHPALATALLALASGCLDSTIINNSNKDQGVHHGDAGMATPPDMAIDPKLLFQTNVQPLLTADCGGCHSQAGGSYPGFLAAKPDVYTTFIAYPGLVGSTPETSRILIKDQHVGPSYHAANGYTPSADLQAHAKIISDWVVQFNLAGGHAAGASDMGTKSRVMPFAPVMGTQKTIDLGELGAAFLGMTVTFTPEAIGTTQIKLRDLTIKGTAASGVHVKSPVFARYEAAAPTVAVDIDYDFLGKDITAYAGMSQLFDPSLVIFSFTPGQLLDLSFDTIELASGSADMGGAVGACKNVPGFTAFKTNLTGGLGINCSSCHNAGVGGFSTGGFTNNANDVNSCAATLVNTIPATPNTSPIYTAVTDGNNHTGGKLSATDATNYLNALTTWLNGEK